MTKVTNLTKVTKRCLRLVAVVAFASAFVLAFAPGFAGAAGGGAASTGSPQRAGWWDMTVAGGAPPPTTVPSPPPTTLPPVPETTLPPPPPLPSTTVPSAPSTTVPSTTVPSTTVPSSKNAATIEVGNDDAQYTEIGAIQYAVSLNQAGLRVDPKTIDALLVLTVVPGASAGTPKLVACPATSNWSAGADQKAKTAPRYDCQGPHAAKGVYNAVSLTVTWNLSSLQESAGHPGVFSVVILPAGKPRDAGVFNVSLKPDSNSFRMLSWAPTGGAGGYVPPPPVPPPPAGISGSGSPVASGSGGGSPSVGFTAPSSAGASPTAGASPSNPSSAPSTPTSPPASLGAARPAALHTLGSGAARELAIALLIALGLLASSASGRTGRLPRLLVPLPAKVNASSGDGPPGG